MSTPKRWTVDEVRHRLRDLHDPAPDSLPPLDPYRAAASVLSELDPATLRPMGAPSAPPGAPEALLRSCVPVQTQDGRKLVALRSELRAETLRLLLKTGRAEEALDANRPTPSTPLQRALESTLRGSPPAAERIQSVPDAAALAAVTGWLEGAVPGLPTRQEAESKLEVEKLLDPLRAKTSTFAGRAEELAALRKHVGALRDEGGHTVFDPAPLTHLAERPPLVVWGPGGVGKSTLISRFVLEHTDVPPREQLPFAYLDFDRTGLFADRPLTLLHELIRQLAVLIPARRAALQAALPPLRDDIDAYAHRTSTTERDREHLARLARLLREADLDGTPLLLVLDTFEEVQYRRASSIERLWAFLLDFQSAIPCLRIVIAGRSALPSSLPHRSLVLSGLDEQASIAVLANMGVTEPSLAHRSSRGRGQPTGSRPRGKSGHASILVPRRGRRRRADPGGALRPYSRAHQGSVRPQARAPRPRPALRHSRSHQGGARRALRPPRTTTPGQRHCSTSWPSDSPRHRRGRQAASPPRRAPRHAHLASPRRA
ncbi:MAG: ATP-binding protein [Polyangiaceae bacterium]